MEHLETRDQELVALGAAMGSNCVPCIEYHIPQARGAGLTDAQIAEAIRFADNLRKVPAAKVLHAAQTMLAPKDAAPEAGCDRETAGETKPEGGCCV